MSSTFKVGDKVRVSGFYDNGPGLQLGTECVINRAGHAVSPDGRKWNARGEPYQIHRFDLVETTIEIPDHTLTYLKSLATTFATPATSDHQHGFRDAIVQVLKECFQVEVKIVPASVEFVG